MSWLLRSRDFWIVVGGVLLAFLAMLLLRGLIGLALVCIIVALIWAATAKRGQIESFFARKLVEWRSDWKQLCLWTSLAFARDRSAHDTAAMTHQMHFLQGRIMSPINIFTLLPIIFALLGTSFGFINGWRVDRVKHERDAPCSQSEVTKHTDGKYHTTRQACASLGEQTSVTLQWRTRAIEAEAARIRDIAQVRMDNELAIRAERERRARVAASTERQRRRQDEDIIAALGGPSPDLDRSMCELAGGADCGSARQPAATGSAAAPADLHAGAGTPAAVVPSEPPR